MASCAIRGNGNLTVTPRGGYNCIAESSTDVVALFLPPIPDAYAAALGSGPARYSGVGELEGGGDDVAAAEPLRSAFIYERQTAGCRKKTIGGFSHIRVQITRRACTVLFLHVISGWWRYLFRLLGGGGGGMESVPWKETRWTSIAAGISRTRIEIAT